MMTVPTGFCGNFLTTDEAYAGLSIPKASVHKHLAAISQAKLSHFHDLFDAAIHDRFMTPIELTGLAR